MPWTTEYHKNGALVRFHGRTTGAEILEAKKQFFYHVFPDTPRYALCDFSEVRIFDVSAADVQRIVRQDLAAVGQGPAVAEVVVAPTPLEYGMSRMWEQQVDQEFERTAVVKSRDEGIAWLKQHHIPLDDRVTA